MSVLQLVMSHTPHTTPPRSQTSPAWRITLLVILAATLLRVLFALFASSYTLIEDEAHYWEWSRRLDLSYYTKGPGVAWSIAASTALFGTSEFAVRLPSIIASGLCTLGAAALARRVFASDRAAFFTTFAVLSSPNFQSMGLIMTIDSPYCACWALAMLASGAALGVYRNPLTATHRPADPRAWLVAGAAIGIGCLYKYTILLALPGLLAAWFLTPRRTATRPHAPWLVLGTVVMFVCTLPIILWNHAQGWPTIAHLLGHLGVAGGDVTPTQSNGYHYNPLWTIDFVASQIALVGPLLFVCIAYCVKQLAAGRTNQANLAQVPAALRDTLTNNPEGQRFLIVTSLPILIMYLLVSLLTEPEGNWPVAGYITLFALVGGPLATCYAWTRQEALALAGRFGAWQRMLWHVACFIGALVALVIPLLPIIDRLPHIGEYVPLHRFQGAERMAAHADRIVADLAHDTGKVPFVMAMHYGRASQLAFYMRGRPVVYCASHYLGLGRPTQYDYFEDTDLRADQGLIGRPALVIGGTREVWLGLFDRVELIGTLDGDGKRDRPAFAAYGYTGMPRTALQYK